MKIRIYYECYISNVKIPVENHGNCQSFIISVVSVSQNIEKKSEIITCQT